MLLPHGCGSRQGARDMIAPKTLARLIGCALAAPVSVWASTPASGTLTTTSGPLTYSAGPFTVANPTPIPEWDVGPECNNPVQPCDDYALTVSLPAGYTTTYPNAAVKVT